MLTAFNCFPYCPDYSVQTQGPSTQHLRDRSSPELGPSSNTFLVVKLSVGRPPCKVALGPSPSLSPSPWLLPSTAAFRPRLLAFACLLPLAARHPPPPCSSQALDHMSHLSTHLFMIFMPSRSLTSSSIHSYLSASRLPRLSKAAVTDQHEPAAWTNRGLFLPVWRLCSKLNVLAEQVPSGALRENVSQVRVSGGGLPQAVVSPRLGQHSVPSLRGPGSVPLPLLTKTPATGFGPLSGHDDVTSRSFLASAQTLSPNVTIFVGTR